MQVLCGSLSDDVMQMAMSEHLKELEAYHISTIPKIRLTRERLELADGDEDAAEALFQELRTALGKLVTLAVHLLHTT